MIEPQDTPPSPQHLPRPHITATDEAPEDSEDIEPVSVTVLTREVSSLRQDVDKLASGVRKLERLVGGISSSINGHMDTLTASLRSDISKLSRKIDENDARDDQQNTSLSHLRAQVSSTQETLFAVKAKQVGWQSLAWAIGVGLFYLIQMLLGGGVPHLGQPPHPNYLPAPQTAHS